MSYCDLLVTRNKFREGTSSTYKFRVRLAWVFRPTSIQTLPEFINCSKVLFTVEMSYCVLLVTRNKLREGTSSTYKFRVRLA